MRCNVPVARLTILPALLLSIAAGCSQVATTGRAGEANAPLKSRGHAEILPLASIAPAPGETGFDLAMACAQDRAGDLYLLEYPSSRVRVFSPDGDSLRTFWRHRSGSRAAWDALAFAILPDSSLGVITATPALIIRFDRRGNLTGRAPVGSACTEPGTAVMIRKALCRGGTLVLGGIEAHPTDQQQARTHFVRRYGSLGEILATYATRETVLDMTTRHTSETEAFAPLTTSFAVGPDGRVYVAPERNAYRIEVYSPEGALEHVIERDFVPWARTAADSARVKCLFEGWVRDAPLILTYDLEPTEPAILALEVDDQGRLWVRHSRSAHDPERPGRLAFDLFDREGRFTKVIDVACDADDGLHFLGDGRAVVVRNEAGAEFVRAGGRLGWLAQAEIASAASLSPERALLCRLRE
jgi:hypothetical protein